MTQKIVEMKRRSDKDWQHSSGATMFVFEITVDDGLTGFANARSETPWYNVGSEVNASVRSNHNGDNTLKLDKPEFANATPNAMQPNKSFLATSSDTDHSIVASWAIDHAMKWPQANKSIDSVRETAKQLMELQHELKVHHKSKFP